VQINPGLACLLSVKAASHAPIAWLSISWFEFVPRYRRCQNKLTKHAVTETQYCEISMRWNVSPGDSRTKHDWWVFETVPYRLPASLSDLAGYDHGIHNRTVDGLFRALLDAFVVLDDRQLPLWIDEEHLMRIYS
jgi:hypothetical protein